MKERFKKLVNDYYNQPTTKDGY